MARSPAYIEISRHHIYHFRIRVPKTLGDKRSAAELMKRIVGNKPIDQISRADAGKFKETSLKLPPRMGQLPPRPIKELIKEAATTISATTFNNYVKNLTGFTPICRTPS